MIREVRREGEGAAHGECGCSSLRVQWWWMLTMNSHGVEISIARCVTEIVRAPNLMPFFFFFFFFFFLSCALYEQPTGTKTTYSASYGNERTPSPNFLQLAPGKKPSTQVSLVRDQPHTSRAKQENPPPTKGAEQETSNKYTGRNQK